MPNKHTFDIKPIKQLICKYMKHDFVSVDPFANKSKICSITNDLDPQFETTYCLDAIDFLKKLEDKSVDFMLYDPPYSVRQVSECYKKMNMTVNMQTTQSSYWSNQKTEISRVMRKDGIVMCFGWNSGGIGKKNCFEMIEIMLVAHGGPHNDTICTVESRL